LYVCYAEYISEDIINAHIHDGVLFKIIKINYQFIDYYDINYKCKFGILPDSTDHRSAMYLLVDICIIMHNFRGAEQNANSTLQYLNAQTSSAAKYNVEVMCYAIQSVKNVENISRRFYLVSILFTWMDTSIRNFPP